ncbi:hypothetical protein SLS62_006685 [Diatrype stigma]|uniref:Sulfhydryl oxidase n=1 Tax=Diatrype stigma TaxID=117547 RepID=A0AAN9YRH6_9PEZI
MVILAVAAFLTLSFFMSSLGGHDTARIPQHELSTAGSGGSTPAGHNTNLGAISEGVLHGGAIAPKLENATAKAELGRASWKLFHTMMARFPEEPTEDDSLALRTYIQLFARLYPCGDCASHFQQLLAKYPPQVGSRNSAAGWACFVHNQVNARLEKPQFDCTKIGDFYDCGCGEEGEGEAKGGDKKAGSATNSGSSDGGELKDRS